MDSVSISKLGEDGFQIGCAPGIEVRLYPGQTDDLSPRDDLFFVRVEAPEGWAVEHHTSTLKGIGTIAIRKVG